MVPGFCIELDCTESKKSSVQSLRKRIRTLNHRATKRRKEPALLRLVGRSVRRAALVVIALAGCASNLAAADWDDDPDTFGASGVVLAQAVAPKANLMLRKWALAPRQIDRNIFGAPAPGVDRFPATSLQNFYCLHKHIRERAPPPLVQIK